MPRKAFHGGQFEAAISAVFDAFRPENTLMNFPLLHSCPFYMKLL
jgi:hypothetical protein